MRRLNLIILSLLLTGCVSQVTDNVITTANDDSNKAFTTKTVAKVKHKRHSLPDGVISVDIVESNKIIHLLLGKHLQGKKSLWYQQSIDAGVSWSDAVKVIDQDHLEANFNRGSDAQLAVQGNNIVAIWASRVEGNTVDLSISFPFSLALLPFVNGFIRHSGLRFSWVLGLVIPNPSHFFKYFLKYLDSNLWIVSC